jgi:hypothetical protein
MHLILRYLDGTRTDALLLSFHNNVMRVVVRGRNETQELEFVYDRWVDEEGQRICLEAMLAGSYEVGNNPGAERGRGDPLRAMGAGARPD